jgi:hypothetical protein
MFFNNTINLKWYVDYILVSFIEELAREGNKRIFSLVMQQCMLPKNQCGPYGLF